ncbi:MAG: hypothetical protein RLZZ15_3396 [Verrucomicrobiota bacterium]|jgi:hypothetical protein
MTWRVFKGTLRATMLGPVRTEAGSMIGSKGTTLWFVASGGVTNRVPADGGYSFCFFFAPFFDAAGSR